MRIKRIEFKEVKALALIILLIVTLGSALVKMKSQQAVLQESHERVQKLTAVLNDFTVSIPRNSAEWFKQGCEQSLGELLDQLGDERIHMSVEVFTLQLTCSAKALEVQKELSIKIKEIIEQD